MVEETFPQFFSTFDMDKSAGKSTISKITKFESDLLKTNEDIVVERHTILEMFVWCSGAKDTNLLHPPPPPYKCLQIFAILRSYIFAHLRCMTFKLGNFTKF